MLRAMATIAVTAVYATGEAKPSPPPRGASMNRRLELLLLFFLSTLCMPLHAGESKNCGLKQLASLELPKFPARVLVPITMRGSPFGWFSIPVLPSA